jgi:hypothetical protein
LGASDYHAFQAKVNRVYEAGCRCWPGTRGQSRSTTERARGTARAAGWVSPGSKPGAVGL